MFWYMNAMAKHDKKTLKINLPSFGFEVGMAAGAIDICHL